MRVRSLGSIVATVVLALSIGSPPVVDASNFGSAGDVGSGGTTNGVFLTDEAEWRVARRSLATANSTAVANAASDCSATSLNAFVSFPTSCTDASHDVCVFDSAYGNNGGRCSRGALPEISTGGAACEVMRHAAPAPSSLV